jgi:thymidylate synthase (FAD)
MTPEQIEQHFLNEKPSRNRIAFDPPVFTTDNGTHYLTEPGVALISQPNASLVNAEGFLRGYGFGDTYLDDERRRPHGMGDGVALAKFGGQLCYLSLGAERTKNVDYQKYIDHILDSGHGSVLEHANYSLLIYGVSRALTHELIRHRHASPSQLSQRYVPGKHLRFVADKKTASSSVLLGSFKQYIDAARKEYAFRESVLLLEAGVTGKVTTEQRKAVRQTARRCLPNETETVLLLTGNIRAWRGVIDQRSSPHADAEIASLSWRLFLTLAVVEPAFWLDYEVKMRDDGIPYVETTRKKV